MKEAVDHVERSLLPWRSAETGLTECGLPVASYPTITRAAYFSRVKDLGQQRAAMLTCMTCAETTRRWRTWDESPIDAIKRESEKHFWHHDRRPADNAEPRVIAAYEHWDAFRRELLAIAALIAEHREEFDAHVTGLGDVVKLDEARRARTERKRQAAADRRTKW